MNEMNENLVSNMDKTTLDNAVQKTEDTVVYFENIISQITNFYTKEITEIMENIKTFYDNIATIDTSIIEGSLLRLTNAIYFMGTNIEALGIRNDISEALYKEVYNKEYLDQQNIAKDKKLTQATLQALADNKAMYENLVNSIYERAYKNVKFRIDSASDMARVLSKMLTKRINEMNTISPDSVDGYKFS